MVSERKKPLAIKIIIAVRIVEVSYAKLPHQIRGV
jgi:hypothetical protein